MGVTVLLVAIVFAFADDVVSGRFKSRLDVIDSTYATALQNAETTQFSALQKANTDRVKVLQQGLAEATKAGDMESAATIKKRLVAAEAEGVIRPKPKNVATFNSHQYALVNDKMTWHQAKRRCEEMGGHLVTIESPNELAFVLAFCRRNKVSVWLGLSNEDKLQWKWVSGVPAHLNPTWKIDDPQREHFSGAMTFWVDSNSFNDHNFGAFLGFVCEWEKVK